jgi:hypothetical protein
MKIIYSLSLLFILLAPLHSFCQIATEPRTEEYSTVRVVMSSQTGNFSTTTSLANPFLEMETGSMELKDFIKDPKGAKFETPTEIMNYMNKFGWILQNIQTVEITGSKTGDFILYYTFKRKPKTK